MPDSELVKTLDYILNRSDASSIEVVAQAVVRRRRELSIYLATGSMPDPKRMAQQITEQITLGVDGGIESMRQSIREMIVRIIHEHAPELSDAQVDELCQSWLPQQPENEKTGNTLPRNVLESMIEQFIAFSCGTMKKSVDKNLREEMGAWPQRYWESFPAVIRNIITEYLKGKITGKEFNSKINIALDL